ncbi:DgaE family pyridoxal phosphate-dependent ammonia lyase [Paenibacillus lutimineralis]|uniref:DgaE family pyridoxal phosphate-dependent ammonia lyase n=1 Tax=Paenibacillus lutimineralis TaxID=2707005 RepID=A0A3Q9I9Q1_9BACL|nr:DgaE family pyridoxal phosphate-dependent ammonia lyase [Paenibacillus lutimineralis]AZS14253.1 DgaE family pyridoxal phosphate-dependent ammonia lyase [Paenibacillus lutimineralis]
MGHSLNAKYGLKRVINASGRMSILGVSAPSDTVMEAMRQGGQSYVEIADLVDKAGDRIAGILGSEAAVVVNSASSGIALSVAGIVTRGERRQSERLHQEPIHQNEIIILKGHNVQYGAPVETMVYLGGGKLVEVGYANEGRAEHIEDAISEKTAAILYVKSHHAVQKNMISVEEAWAVAQRNGIPLIVDAAAEEDLQKYVKCSDLAIYSGSKAIEGPTSGIVAGRRTYIEWVKVQLSGIGRSMKVGKETSFGLLQALDEYMVKEDHSEQEKETLQVLMPLNELAGVQVTIVQDEAGRAIFRARVQIDPQQAGVTAKDVVAGLKDGDIAVYTRDYGVRQGYFDIDPRPLLGDDIHVIESRIRELAGGKQDGSN